MPISDYILLVILLVATVTDLTSRRIPNLLVMVALGSFAVLSFFYLSTGLALRDGCIRAGIFAFGSHFLLYCFKGLGAGDVKLALVIGLFLGMEAWLNYLAYYAGLIILIAGVLVIGGNGKKAAIPLAPLMMAAYLLSLISMI